MFFFEHLLEGYKRTLGVDSPNYAVALQDAASVKLQLGDLSLAESMYRQSLRVLEKYEPEYAAVVFSIRSQLIYYFGDPAQREDDLRSLVTSAGSGLEANSENVLRVRLKLARTLMAKGRGIEAETILLGILDELKGASISPAFQADVLAAVGEYMIGKGGTSQAVAYLRESLAIRESLFGRENSITISTKTQLADALIAAGDRKAAENILESAISEYERAVGSDALLIMQARINLASLHLNQSQFLGAYQTLQGGMEDFEKIFSQQRQGQWASEVTAPYVRAYLYASIALNRKRILPESHTAHQNFEAQGWLTFGALDVTLADLGSRLRLPPGPEASALRDLQDARDAVQTARRVYLASFDDPGVTDAARKPLADRLTEAESRFAAASARIERDFPALAEIQLPRALKADEAQALLRPGEGLVAYASTEDVLFAWLVTKDRIEWRQIDQTAADLASRVSGLRAAVDFDAVAPAQPPARACALSSPYAGMEDRAFDLCAAQELHGLVLGQFDLSGIEELIVVPDGALEQLPFSLLVTGTDADRSPHWLIEDLAISTLPTTSSLRALRQAAPARADSGTGRLPYLGLAPATFGDQPAVPELRSGRYDLPSTADEVRFISGVLAAGREGVVTGPAASEAWVRSADLSRYVVISFATHALLSREAEDITGGAITEPALLLHPGDGQDGFLTASEAATLRLDADWVLLSACNTAAGEAADAEGLSGLARAFFFAGAKALMVSHWKVDDSAAMALMTETMQRSASRNMSRAQALRQAMLTVMNSPDQDYRHPFFWAPFVLVGETAK